MRMHNRVQWGWEDSRKEREKIIDGIHGSTTRSCGSTCVCSAGCCTSESCASGTRNSVLLPSGSDSRSITASAFHKKIKIFYTIGTVLIFDFPQQQPISVNIMKQQPPKEPSVYEYKPSSYLSLSIFTLIACGIFSPLTLTLSIPALLLSIKV